MLRLKIVLLALAFNANAVEVINDCCSGMSSPGHSDHTVEVSTDHSPIIEMPKTKEHFVVQTEASVPKEHKFHEATAKLPTLLAVYSTPQPQYAQIQEEENIPVYKSKVKGELRRAEPEVHYVTETGCTDGCHESYSTTKPEITTVDCADNCHESYSTPEPEIAPAAHPAKLKQEVQYEQSYSSYPQGKAPALMVMYEATNVRPAENTEWVESVEKEEYVAPREEEYIPVYKSKPKAEIRHPKHEVHYVTEMAPAECTDNCHESYSTPKAEISTAECADDCHETYSTPKSAASAAITVEPKYEVHNEQSYTSHALEKAPALMVIYEATEVRPAKSSEWEQPEEKQEYVEAQEEYTPVYESKPKAEIRHLKPAVHYVTETASTDCTDNCHESYSTPEPVSTTACTDNCHESYSTPEPVSTTAACTDNCGESYSTTLEPISTTASCTDNCYESYSTPEPEIAPVDHVKAKPEVTYEHSSVSHAHQKAPALMVIYQAKEVKPARNTEWAEPQEEKVYVHKKKVTAVKEPTVIHHQPAPSHIEQKPAHKKPAKLIALFKPVEVVASHHPARESHHENFIPVYSHQKPHHTTAKPVHHVVLKQQEPQHKHYAKIQAVTSAPCEVICHSSAGCCR